MFAHNLCVQVFDDINAKLQETVAGIVNTSRCLTADTERDLSRAPNKLETHVKHVHDTLTAQLEAKSRDIAQHEMRIKEELRMLTSEREKLDSERRRFDDEIRRVQELNRISDTRVRLNIGGHTFMTSTLTLTRDVDSMLAAMFSGRHALTQEADGSYFIDRDGTHFRYILNYLRDGGFRNDALPTDKGILSEVLAEAEFYQLSGLSKLLSDMIRKNDDDDDDDDDDFANDDERHREITSLQRLIRDAISEN